MQGGDASECAEAKASVERTQEVLSMEAGLLVKCEHSLQEAGALADRVRQDQQATLQLAEKSESLHVFLKKLKDVSKLAQSLNKQAADAQRCADTSTADANAKQALEASLNKQVKNASEDLQRLRDAGRFNEAAEAEVTLRSLQV